MRLAATCVLALAAMTACDYLASDEPDDAGAPDAPIDPVDAAVVDAALVDASHMPESLRDTGLYADFATGLPAPGVREYQPAYELWSDSAAKKRWIYVPEGAVIDTADMDFWSFPTGTKLWKEFTRDGVRVETRLLYKTGEGRYDWYMMAYAWNQAQTEALAAPGGVQDALGTGHDVPGTADCAKCHERMPSTVIGFSAILLDHDLGGLTLADAIDQDLLSSPPEAAAPPYFPLPGDDTARAALGYLHTNCGNCHNPQSDVASNVPIDLRLAVDSLGAVEDTPVYTSAVGVEPQLNAGPGVTALIEPGDPAASAVHVRMSSRQAIQMPPVGTELVDDQGLAQVDAWIESLAAQAAADSNP